MHDQRPYLHEPPHSILRYALIVAPPRDIDTAACTNMANPGMPEADVAARLQGLELDSPQSGPSSVFEARQMSTLSPDDPHPYPMAVNFPATWQPDNPEGSGDPPQSSLSVHRSRAVEGSVGSSATHAAAQMTHSTAPSFAPILPRPGQGDNTTTTADTVARRSSGSVSRIPLRDIWINHKRWNARCGPCRSARYTGCDWVTLYAAGSTVDSIRCTKCTSRGLSVAACVKMTRRPIASRLRLMQLRGTAPVTGGGSERSPDSEDTEGTDSASAFTICRESTE